jgi:hypothetical protein
MIEDADRLGFPLIELPPPASFNEIIGAVLGVILDVQSVRLQRAAEIHDRFTKIVLGGGGLRPIAEALADSIAMPVAIVDGQGHASRLTATADQRPSLPTVQRAVAPWWFVTVVAFIEGASLTNRSAGITRLGRTPLAANR